MKKNERLSPVAFKVHFFPLGDIIKSMSAQMDVTRVFLLCLFSFCSSCLSYNASFIIQMGKTVSTDCIGN